jgi:hypothetical protein
MPLLKREGDNRVQVRIPASSKTESTLSGIKAENYKVLPFFSTHYVGLINELKKLNQMKKNLLSIIAFATSVLAGKAQITEGFDRIPIDSNSYIIGTNYADTLYNGISSITSDYDTAWQYWSGGFALSNVKDTTTSGFGNLYGCKGYKGLNESPVYLVGQNYSSIKYRKNQEDNYINKLKGLYVNNSTYAYNSMKNGDQFAKKFGGVNGSDPDYFILTIKGKINGSEINDSVNFYLADYRYSNNSEDYIIKDWKWIDLSTLSNADEISFSLTSSDIGAFGMNTPAFFCIDQLVYEDYQEPIQNENTFDDKFTNSDSVANRFDAGYFYSDLIKFQNSYDTIFNYWSGGWAISSMQDSITAGYTNLFSTISGKGYLSSTYGVGQNNSELSYNQGSLLGFYITNSTYAYHSMLNGDQFAKKFGGLSGNDPDYFKLYIVGTEIGNNNRKDTVEVYLADYRFYNNEQDYILKKWEWVDLSKFSTYFGVNILFYFESSDTGSFGINTPMFFCTDHFLHSYAGISSLNSKFNSTISLFPNPSSGIVNIRSADEIINTEVLSIEGRLIQKFGNTKSLDLTNYNPGAYLIKIETENGINTSRIVKH